MSDESKPSWNELIFACRDCRKRSRGPDMKAKVMVAAIKERAREVRPRPRVVLGTCLRLCPKGATAVVDFKEGQTPRMMAITRIADIAKMP